MIQHCKIPGCSQIVHNDFGFCWWHWELVSIPTRVEIWNNFRKVDLVSGRPSVLYLAKIQEAVNQVVENLRHTDEFLKDS